MEPLAWAIFTAGTILLTLWLRGDGASVFSRKKYPGPTILETIWCFIKHRNECHILFKNWSLKYGPIYSVFLGLERYFILSDGVVAKEAYARQESSGRADVVFLDPYFTGTKGLMNTDGKEFSDHKRFSVSILREFGFGRPEMEMKIMEQVAQLLAHLKASEGRGKAFFVKNQFFATVINSVWIAIASKPVDKCADDERMNVDFTPMFRTFLEALERHTQNPLLVLSPKMTKKLSWLPFWRNYHKSFNRVAQFVEGVIDQHKKTITAGEPRDLIDAYIQKSESGVKDPNSIFHEGAHLVDLVVDFLIAGSGTTALIMEWSFLYLVRNPKIQKLARDQVHKVVGLDRLPLLKDRPNLPLVEAIVHEVCRLCPPSLMGIPHKIHRDFPVNEYTLTKDANILTDIYFIQRNPAVWENPDEFQPQRFLDKETGQVIKPLTVHLIPFSTGMRKCIGRSLALDTLFLLLSGVLSRFQLEVHPDYPPPTVKPEGSFMFSPHNFPVQIRDIGRAGAA